MTNQYEQFSGERYSRYSAECARMASFAHNPDAPTLHSKPQDEAYEIEAIRLDSGKQNPREAIYVSRKSKRFVTAAIIISPTNFLPPRSTF
jgi:hypothetical protein